METLLKPYRWAIRWRAVADFGQSQTGVPIMYIQRSNYWPGIDLFPREFSRALSRLFDADGTDLTDVATSEWAPRVDVREDDGRFVISADIPGVDPKEIEIQ